MKLYISYIAYDLFIAILAIIFALTGIIWLSQSLRYASLVVNSGIDFTHFIQLTLLIIPSLLFITIPVAIFVGTAYLYNKLVNDGELIVLNSCGLTRKGVANPLILILTLLTILSYLISLYILPYSYGIFKEKLAFYREHYTSLLLEDGVFNSKIKGLTIYLEERLPDNSLKEVFVYDARNNNSPIAIMAEKGIISKDNTGLKIALFEGNRQEISKTGELSILYFDHIIYDVELTPDQKDVRWREPQERYLKELFFPSVNDKSMVNKLKAEGHNRLTWPLYNLIMAFIAMISVYPREINRKGHSKRIFFGSIIAFMIIASAVIVTNMTANYPSLAFLPYLYVLALLVLTSAIYFMETSHLYPSRKPQKIY